MSLKHLLKGFKLPNSIQFNKVSEESHIGKFELQPFERGMGQTIGNTLRRTLLSSIPNYAVSAVKITVYEGDSHKYVSSEFENIEGVQEDSIDIIEAIRKMRFRFDSDDVLQEMFKGEFKGKGPCTAAIFEKTGCEILNADEVLFTASDSVDIVFEINVELGRGFIPSEIIEKNIEEKGTIPLDVIFSPVTSVSIAIENMRIGYRNDYEKLMLTVKTNGGVSPGEAVAQAAKIIKDNLTLLIDFDEEEVEQNVENVQQLIEMQKMLDLSIEELELSSRSSNCLKAANIRTILELVSLTEKDISSMPNFGAKSMDEIKQKLHDMGLVLGMPLQEVLKRTT